MSLGKLHRDRAVGSAIFLFGFFELFIRNQFWLFLKKPKKPLFKNARKRPVYFFVFAHGQVDNVKEGA
jgi:hypothetical protein